MRKGAEGLLQVSQVSSGRLRRCQLGSLGGRWGLGLLGGLGCLSSGGDRDHDRGGNWNNNGNHDRDSDWNSRSRGSWGGGLRRGSSEEGEHLVSWFGGRGRIVCEVQSSSRARVAEHKSGAIDAAR